MDSFSKLFEKKNSRQVILLVLFIIYLIMGYKTPEPLASLIDTNLGKIIVFILSILLFSMVNPIVGVFGLLVAYELVRRSRLATGSYALDNYLPSEIGKANDLSAINQFPYTLEQEVVSKMAPVKQNYDMLTTSSWNPVLDDLHDAAPVDYKGVI